MDKTVERLDKRPFYHIWEANLLYFLIAIGLMTVAAMAQRANFYTGMVFTEYGLLLAPVILMGFIGRVNMKEALSLKPLKPLHGLLIMVMGLLLLPTIMAVNYFVIWLLSFSDKVVLPEIPTAQNTGEFIFLFFIISISAGLCEEFFFRGMVLNAYSHGINKKWGILLSGILFGVFHFDMQRLLGTMILGIVFAYLVEITGSIWSAVIAHMTNNGIAVLLSYGATRVLQALPQEQMEAQMAQSEQMLSNPGLMLTNTLVSAVLAAICLIPVYMILKKIKDDLNPYEPGSTFTVKGVDYLVLDNYNDSVLAIQSQLVDQDPDNLPEDKKRHVTFSKLKALGASRKGLLWNNDKPKPQKFMHYLPWLGVIGLYGYYVVRHLSYVKG